MIIKLKKSEQKPGLSPVSGTVNYWCWRWESRGSWPTNTGFQQTMRRQKVLKIFVQQKKSHQHQIGTYVWVGMNYIKWKQGWFKMHQSARCRSCADNMVLGWSSPPTTCDTHTVTVTHIETKYFPTLNTLKLFDVIRNIMCVGRDRDHALIFLLSWIISRDQCQGGVVDMFSTLLHYQCIVSSAGITTVGSVFVSRPLSVPGSVSLVSGRSLSVPSSHSPNRHQIFFTSDF